MKTIQIIENNCDRYTIKSDCYCLGRQWDNKSEQIQVIRPERELDNTCTMIVSVNGVVIDHLDIKNEPKDITDVLSRNLNIEISFSFTNIDGYVKNSEIKEFYFLESRKPENFMPTEPEQSGKLDIVLGNAFIDVDIKNGVLSFYNANNDVVKEFELPTIGGGSMGVETDPTVPNWAKQPNKPTYMYEEILNKPSIPSVNGLASETYVNNKASTALSESKSYTDSKISNLVGSAPAALDTIHEIASALNNNPNLVTVLNNAISLKQDSTDNTLKTNSKTIVGAINEINDRLGSAGTQLQNILGV